MKSWTRTWWLLALVGSWGTTLVGCGDEATVPDQPDFLVELRDVDYDRGRYFFLSDPDSAPAPRIDLQTLSVHLDDYDSRNDIDLGAEQGIVVIDPVTPDEGPRYKGAFHPLEEERDYYLLHTDLYFSPVLVLRNRLSQSQTLAVSYRDTTETGDLRQVGTPQVTWPDTLLLKMVRPSKATWFGEDLTRSRWAPLHRYELKNIYNLGVRDIRPDDFSLWVTFTDDIEIRHSFPNYRLEEIPLTSMLGLDQRNNGTGEQVPDGWVDPEFVDFESGLLFFPDLRPFDPSLVDVQGHVNPPAPGRWRTRSWPRTPGVARPDTLGWDQDLAGNPIRSPLADEQTVPELYDLREDRLLSLQQQFTRFSIRAAFNVD